MSGYVLVVEGDATQAAIYQKELEAVGLQMLPAADVETATNLFLHYESELLAVIVDGGLSGGYLDTIPLIQWMRESSNQHRPLIAASMRQDYRLTMVQYGCTDGTEKQDAVSLLVKRLQKLHQSQ